jgi:hypothetical protein
VGFDWLVPLAPDPWLAGLTGVALVLLAVSGVLAHWPRRFPGPLTVAERQRARPGGAGPLSQVVLPVGLAIATFAGALLLLSPPRRPVDLALISRLRPASVPCPELDAASAERRRLDLGPAVDRELQACRDAGGGGWVRGSAGERAKAREAILPVLADFDLPQGGPGRGDATGLPPWLVRSVEYSAMAVALRRLNVKVARVAAGADPPEGWPLGAEVLRARARATVELVDQLDHPPDGLRVRRLTGARAIGTTLTVWAVIEGSLPEASKASLDFQVIPEDEAPRPLKSVELKGDGLSSRVRRLTLSLASAPSASERLTLADAGGRCRAPVRAGPETTPPSPRLRIVAADDDSWKALLERVTKAPGFQPVRDELKSLGIALPEPAVSGDRVLLVEAGRAAMAATEVTCRKALSLPAVGGGSLARVSTTRLEPGTIFSWLALPVQPPASDQGEAVVTADHATVGRQVLVAVGLADGKPYVLFQGEAALPPASEEPFRGLAQARSLAWAARYLDEAASADPTAATALPEGLRDPPACPLLTEADLHALTAAGLARLDASVVAVVGFYLAYLLFRVARNLPRT